VNASTLICRHPSKLVDDHRPLQRDLGALLVEKRDPSSAEFVEPFERLDEVTEKGVSSLLAVGDHVEAGVFLQGDGSVAAGSSMRLNSAGVSSPRSKRSRAAMRYGGRNRLPMPSERHINIASVSGDGHGEAEDPETDFNAEIAEVAGFPEKISACSPPWRVLQEGPKERSIGSSP